MPKSRSIWHRISNNELQKCAIPSCDKRRTQVAKFCAMHRSRHRRWGHPIHGKMWERRYINSYLANAQQFVSENREHRGISAAITFLQALLDHAHANTSPPTTKGRLARALRHCSEFGVTGEVMLARWVAVMLYAEEYHRHDMEYEVMLTNAGYYVLLAAPRLGNTHSHRKNGRLLGTVMWSNLSALFVRIIVHHRKGKRETAALKEACSTPFDSSNATHVPTVSQPASKSGDHGGTTSDPDPTNPLTEKNLKPHKRRRLTPNV